MRDREQRFGILKLVKIQLRTTDNGIPLKFDHLFGYQEGFIHYGHFLEIEYSQFIDLFICYNFIKPNLKGLKL